VIEHAEDVSLRLAPSMREGIASTRLGLSGMPAAAESVCVRATFRSRSLPARSPHAHLSAKRLSNKSLRQEARLARHLRSHSDHFTLIDEDVTYDSRFKMKSAARRSRRFAKRF